MKRSNYLQQLIDKLLNRNKIESDLSSISKEDHSILQTAKLVASARYEAKPYRMEFKDELEKKVRKLAGHHQKKKKQKRKNWRQFIHVKTLTAVGVGALTMVVVAVSVNLSTFKPLGVIQPTSVASLLIPVAHAQDNFSLTANQLDDYGVISPDSTFRLESKVPVNVNDLEEALTISTASAFTLSEQEKGTVFEIELEDALPMGALMNVSIATRSESDELIEEYEYEWVFEVSEQFNVLSTTPADRGTMSGNQAVQFRLSHLQFVDPSAYILVEPAHDFTVRQEGYTVSVIPTTPWEEDELYTITLKKGFGLDSNNIDELDQAFSQLNEDYVLQFTTGEDIYTRGGVYYPETVLQSAIGQSVSIYANAYQIPETLPLEVEVYKLNSDQLPALLDRMRSLKQWLPEMVSSKLSQRILNDFVSGNSVSSYDVQNDQFNDYYGMAFELNPINENGIYLVSASYGGQPQLFVWSVSELGGAISLTTENGLVWAMNVSKEEVWPSVDVRLNNELIGTTDSEGVLLISRDSIQSMDQTNFFVLQSGQEVTVIPAQLWSPGSSYPDYEHFLLIDQSLAHPTDELKFWGRAHKLDGPRSDLMASISAIGDGYAFTVNHIWDQNLTLSDQGFFHGTVTLNEWREGRYYLEILDGEFVIDTMFFEVKEFATPSVQISMQPQYKRVDAGESNRISIQVTRFDGNSAANETLILSGDYDGTITTNENGYAEIDVPSSVSECSDYGCYQGWKYVDARLASADRGESYSSASWTVTQSYTDVVAEYEANENEIVFNAEIDGLEYLTRQTAYPAQDQIKRFDAVGVPFLVQVFRITSEQSDLRTEYDSYTNEVALFYEFDRQELLVDTHEGLTDQQGKLQIVIPREEKANYRIRTRVLDRFQRYDGDTTYVNLQSLPSGRVYVQSDEETEIQVPNQTMIEDYLFMDVENLDERFVVGDEVNLTLTLGDENKLGAETLSMVYSLSPNIRETFVQKGNQFAIPIIEDYKPNFYLSSFVLYNKQVISQDYQAHRIDLDQEEDRLSVEIDLPKNDYGIRDEVTGVLTVTDVNGDPVQAEVQLNVLDKAYVNLDIWSDTNPLDGYYQSDYSNVLLTKTSHNSSRLLADGLGGGGGEDGRAQLVDQAHYEILSTDKNGKANFSFDLPDNLTTWVIGAYVASTDYRGGLGTKEIFVYQPIAIEPLQAESYLSADEIVIGAQASLENPQDGIQYAFYGPIESDSAQGLSLEDFPVANATMSADFNEMASFNIGSLQPGRYAYAIRANIGDLQDTVIEDFTVIANRSGMLTTKSEQVSEGWKAPLISDANGRIQVRFNSPLTSQILSELTTYCKCGTRLDSYIAWYGAQKLLSENFDLGDVVSEKAIPSEYQSTMGGLTYFPYATTDVRLSSEVLKVLEPEEVPVTELAHYFNSILDTSDSASEQVLAFRGLAALQQPVYAQFNQFMDQAELGLMSRLVAAETYLLFGDKQQARIIFDEIVDVGERAIISSLENDYSKDEALVLAQMALSVAAELNHDLEQPFYDFIEARDGFTLPIYHLHYWKHALETLPTTQRQFVLQAGNEERFVSLVGRESFGLELSSEELAQLSAVDVRGEIVATMVYESGESDPIDASGFVVERSYSQNGVRTTELVEGQEVDITLIVSASSDAGYGQYLITDYLPSNLSAISRGYTWGAKSPGPCKGSPYRTNNNEAKATTYLSNICPTVTITYKARVIGGVGSAGLAEGTRVVHGNELNRIEVLPPDIIQVIQ